MEAFKPESGSWTCRRSSFDEERWAQRIRALGSGENGPQPVGVLLLRLFGSELNVRRIDGVAPGRYVVRFASMFPNGDCDGPISVAIAREQRPEDLTLAAARACARYGAWAFTERWSLAELEAVAFAIAVPSDAARSSSLRAVDIAQIYCVDLEIVLQRQRLCGIVVRESGERPAVAG